MMRSLEIVPVDDGVIPPRPDSLHPFAVAEPGINSFDALASASLKRGGAIVVGGISLIGDQGYHIPVVGIIRSVVHESEKISLRGWSLHLNHPDRRFRTFTSFDTKHEREGILLPMPNYIVYFGCDVDPALAEENADEVALRQIAQFVLPFISEKGPPQGIDW